MVKLIFITPHLGGGAGKAISGLIKNLKEYIVTVILLEKPVLEKYVNECRCCGATVLIEPSHDSILSLAEGSDAVIYNWWAHPLSVGLIHELDAVDTRLVIWSHINGLQYPELTFDFLNEFDAVMLTSPCSLKSNKFSKEQNVQLNPKCSFVYGIGDFHPDKCIFKHSYEINDHVRIGYIGTMDFAKMNPEFPRICNEIKQQITDVEFIFCGGYTSDFENAFFERYPFLKECTTFMGFVDDPERILLTFDVFCYPLTKDNYATTENALLEAMAAGLPVVVLDNPAESEIVVNAGNGICAHGVDDFISETVLLCRDVSERQRLGMSARDMVIKNYSADNNAKNFEHGVDHILLTEKHRHDFGSIIGNDIWDNFLYFCGSEKDNILRILNGEDVRLPDIFFSKSKSSLKHYTVYYDCEKFSSILACLKY